MKKKLHTEIHNIKIDELITYSKKHQLLKVDKSNFIFLLNNNLDVFKSIENNLKVHNSSYFIEKNRSQKYPIIMNHFEKKYHKHFKKEHLRRINKLIYAGYESFVLNEIQIFFENNLNKNINLIEEITKLFIKTNLEFNYKIKINNEDLYQLYFFKDYYTLGLYLDVNLLEEYYGYSLFVNSLYTFQKIYDDFEKVITSQLSLDIPNHYKINDFYNNSIAGSTNIAKSFAYLLTFVSEFKNDEILTNLNYLMPEYYRYIPLVHNHITSPYLFRKVQEKIRVDNELLSKNDNLFIFHTMENFDKEVFINPYKFVPSRWHGEISKKINNTFGVSLHKCCGMSIANIWLKSLINIFFKNFFILNQKDITEVPYSDKKEFNIILKQEKRIKIKKI